MFIFSFQVVFASSDSIFSASSLDWVRSQIIGAFSDNSKDTQTTTDIQNLMVSQDSYLIKTSSPNTEISPTDQRKELVIEYKVREGDNLTKIARDFGISLNTLLWANNLESVSIIKVGQELRVLPIDGVLYMVKRGDTLIAISQKYKTNQEQVIDFNDLLADGSLKEGVELILPGGIMAFSETIAAKKPITQARATVNKTVSAVKRATKLAFEAAEKFFIIPVSGIITQGKHNYTPPAIDIGNSCGTSIFAAADGVATSIFETNSRSRYAGGGYGNNIRIQHSDGSISLYAHLLAGSLSVNEGETVKQGQKIAEIGGGWAKGGVRMAGAGRSSGCHLHFEVRNGINPYTAYRRGTVVKTPAANLAIDESATGAGDSSDGDNNGTGFSGVVSEPFGSNKGAISEPYKGNQ